MSDGIGNEVQVRIVAEQIADAAIAKFAQMHPELSSKSEIPAVLKWIGAVLGMVFATGIGSTAIWIVSSINTMQVTLARMDERLASQSTVEAARFSDLERRVATNEARLSVLENNKNVSLH